MKIRKNAWHYKFISLHTNPPKNLCSYFWILVGIVIVWFLLWWLIVPAIVMVTLSTWLEKKDIRISRKTKEFKEPGLLRSWVSAKKHKVCPLIEFVE